MTPDKISANFKFYNFKNRIIMISYRNKDHTSWFIQTKLIPDLAIGDYEFPFSFVFLEFEDLINYIENELNIELLVTDKLADKSIRLEGVEIKLDVKSGDLTLK